MESKKELKKLKNKQLKSIKNEIYANKDGLEVENSMHNNSNLDKNDAIIEGNIEDDSINKNKQNKLKDKKKRKSKNNYWRWPLLIFLPTLLISFTFSFISEFLLSGSGLILSIVLLIIFIFFAVFFDMIGVAVTAAEVEPFVAMSSRKVKGAKQALKLVQNSEKISGIFCDIIGDVFGILSGTVGASIVTLITIHGEMQEIMIASFISALVAAFTVFLKALGKTLAVKKGNTIVFILAKIITFFKFSKN